MAFMKRCCEVKSKRGNVANVEETKSKWGLVRHTRGLGGKRILISKNVEESSPESPLKTNPLKRQRSGQWFLPQKSSIESLPQDILIRILCGVDHEDLETLFHVSEAIREAAKIAKRCHFAYSTPKKTPAFRNPVEFSAFSCDFDEIEPPNAPKMKRISRSRIDEKVFSSISTVLFA